MKTLKVGDVVKNKLGHDVRILCVDARGNHPIVGLVQRDESDIVNTYTKEGKYIQVAADEHSHDLVLTEKKKGWINLYKNPGNCYWTSTALKPTKEEAKECIN